MKMISGVSLLTDDVRALSEFYVKILSADADINDHHVVVAVDGGGITIYSKSAAERDMGFAFHLYNGAGLCRFSFAVHDVDAEYERLKALNMGIAFIAEPTTYPWGARAMHFRDPDGHIVCFVN